MFIQLGSILLVSVGVFPPSTLQPILPTFLASGTCTHSSHDRYVDESSKIVSCSAVVSRNWVPVGCYLGEGLLPVPGKLKKNITKLEFVEMHELLPKSWL